MKTVKTNKLWMTPKSRLADREILRDTAHVLRPNRRDWSTATIVALRPISEEARKVFFRGTFLPFSVCVWYVLFKFDTVRWGRAEAPGT
jgi:hypothetical protein